ncbi:hypothetical protein AB0G77_39800 [Streptomyces hygroscopicus]|uniref:hypothetical protein n=1 Tax=Streptomyces hygroscopicus TaxID=1912 RepID=UPI0033F5BBDE
MTRRRPSTSEWPPGVDALTADELQALQQAHTAAGTGGDLRAELAAYIARAQADGGPG